jgi:geranylgeranyl diphosphate synthase type II
MDIKTYLKERKGMVDSFLESYFSASLTPQVLRDSIAYSLSAGGKRVRPVLCLAAYEACGCDSREIIPHASALEFIHTYSLIHDDLPAMDDDDLRRGKPTNHKVFGEGMAILAGDGLLTEAFTLLADESHTKASIHPLSIVRVIHELSRASGIRGMVGGQAQDLISEDQEPDAETLSFIHTHKTAALIAASVRIGGILAGCNDEALLNLTRYGRNIGYAFQVVDDILDVEGETEVLGKPAGSDEKKKKMTYPKLYGLDESKKKAAWLIGGALEALAPFGEKAEPLRGIARYLGERKS